MPSLAADGGQCDPEPPRLKRDRCVLGETRGETTND